MRSPPAKWAREQIVREEIAQMLARRLSDRFGHVQIAKFPLLQRFLNRVSLLWFEVNGKKLGVFVTPANKRDEWCVGVDPLKYTEPVRRLLKEDVGKYAEEFMLVSGEIHTLLKNTSGVEGLRWYFEGWDVHTPAVATPAELPWRLEAG
jgi:hypothetical protein